MILREKILLVLKLLAQAKTNQSICEEKRISIKTIERIVANLNLKYDIDSKIFNSRLRLLVTLLSKDFLIYRTHAQPRLITQLNQRLNFTLILTCIGFANKSIAKILTISEKTVELRLSQLFDYFGVDTKNQSKINPRVELLINAICRSNISLAKIKRLYKETQKERLEKIFENSKNFLDTLDDDYRFVG